MNKIYKVVWNKARNCYVVGSEFISNHSAGKTSVIGSHSIKAVLAVAIVCSTSYFSLSNVFAADGGIALPGQYVAIAANQNDVKTKTYTVDGKNYTYTLQEVTYTDSNNKKQTEYYYVRDGYSVEMEQDKRHDQSRTSNVLRVYRNSATAGDTGLLQSSQVMIKDAMNQKQQTIQTKTGNTLHDVSAGTYVGTSNSGGTETPIDGGYEYFIQDNGKWVDAHVVKTEGARFQSLTPSSNGTYKYKGQVVSIDNLYTVTKNRQPTVGVFVTSSGNLYTGKVFGRNNEVLMTTKNKDTIYSYWAAETMDPDSKIENMTVGQLNNMFNETNTNVKKVAGDAIDHVNVTKSEDGGTISLIRRGTYNPETGMYENPSAVDGSLQLSSTGGTDGKDVTITISQADDKGKYQEKLSLNAGSKVVANPKVSNSTELTSISINGENYTISDFYLRNGTTSLGKDISYGEGESKVTTGYKADDNGNIDMQVSNEKGQTKHVVLTDIASKTALDNLDDFAVKYNTTRKDGTTVIDPTGITLKNAYENKKGGTTITNIAYAEADKNKNTYNGSAAVNVDLLKDQIAGATLKEGNGISITDKKINVKLKDGEQNLVVDTNGLALKKELTGITSINGKISFTNGNVTVNQNTFNSDGRIQNVAAGTEDTDAVNYGQLKQAVSEGNTDTHIKAGEYSVGQDNTVSMDVVDKNGKSTGEKVTIKDVAKASDVGNVSQIAGDIQNKNGNTTVVDAVNNVNNKVGDLNYSTVKAGAISDGDNTTTAIGKLNQKLSDVEQTAGKHSSVSTNDSNLNITEGTNAAGGKDYNISLNKDLTLDSVTTGDTKMDTNGVTVGKNVSLSKDGLTAGDTKITNDGLSIGDKTYVSKDGLNANNQKITNVADGKVEKGSTDAVNGGQLYETNQAVINNSNNISSLSHSLSNLDNRVNKVGAGAAALAALHPLDFDPDAKWDFAAGYGNYRGTNAAAVGAYYRPNEDTMFSVGGTFGNGENMVNAGVSFKLGAGSSHVSTSRVAMAKEIKELRSELEAMKSAMLDATAGKKVDTSKLQLFPDVPQNHWAYEYVAQLAGNGMIEGYPDGNFAGDRPMTRYEFAAILYRAMTKGAVLSDKILSEFSHELEYFTVDTVSKDKAGNPTIQRVRTVKANKNK